PELTTDAEPDAEAHTASAPELTTDAEPDAEAHTASAPELTTDAEPDAEAHTASEPKRAADAEPAPESEVPSEPKRTAKRAPVKRTPSEPKSATQRSTPVPQLAADELAGELVSVQSPWVTVLLTMTLLLVPVVVVRGLLRYVLLYRRPASLRMTPPGLELSQQTLLLGHVLRRRSTVVPLSGLVRITREVRYAGAALYAGLFALTLGTYVGTRRFLEGLQVAGGSLDLFAFAALALLLGVSLDFFLSSVAHSTRGRCRVIVVPTRGRAFGIGSVDAQRADALLTRVSRQVRALSGRRASAGGTDRA